MTPMASALGLLLTLSPAPAPDAIDAVSADRWRIRAHLAQVEAELRAREVDGLPAAAQAARARVLDNLHRYRKSGRFPRNDGPNPQPIPIFIDAEGRTCAVAELMLQSGATELAESVAARENQARVLEMRTELSSWLAENGLTAEEAARIQPAYCHCSDRYVPVCATVMVDGGTQELTFMNQCVVDHCAGSPATLLHTGECSGPGALRASEFNASFESCGCQEGATDYACECRFPGGNGRAPLLGLGALLGAAFVAFTRWNRRR